MTGLRLRFGLFTIALFTLMLELILIRVFDVLFTSNIGYMVITCAMFSFGLGGLFLSLRPNTSERFLTNCAMISAAATLLLLPIINFLPFDPKELTREPGMQLMTFAGIYASLIIPFFFAGLTFATIFSENGKDIQELYFFDLVGAAIGCVIFIPFFPLIGPAGLVFVACGLGLIASALFERKNPAVLIKLGLAVVICLAPALRYPDIYDFRLHMDKRGLKADAEAGRIEFTRWDPVSRVDVSRSESQPHSKHVAYDGGSQSSVFFEFGGDYGALRSALDRYSKEDLSRQFWFSGVLASHYLKRDTGHSALVIGSAGGQEIKAALTYGADRVVGVEMVGTVVELAQNQYADFIGNVQNHPNVTVFADEGRSYLRQHSEVFDVIQIFSNHTSSSIASGTGAMATTYLQTSDAYREYFTHLADDGILHINHHIYPRMVTTASLAWKELGRTNFQDHVIVVNRPEAEIDFLPTMLIKMVPWTEQEVAEIATFFEGFTKGNRRIVENPVDHTASFLPSEFYSGIFPNKLTENSQIRLSPTTDDRPFFNQLRRVPGYVEENPSTFMSRPMAGFLNAQMTGPIPVDLIHLIVVAACSILFAFLFIFVPLIFSPAGRARWDGKASLIGYFSCLGFGFIVIELTLIQMFMKLIGSPLIAAATVLFTMLASAGIGSLASNWLNVEPENRWRLPFIGVAVTGVALILVANPLFDLFLSSPIAIRTLVSFFMIFPVGFFLGMPFPLGILALQKAPTGAVAWAWALNGLFTVMGGVASVVLALVFGFKITTAIALAVYLLAYVFFVRMRRTHVGHASVSKEQPVLDGQVQG